MNRDFKIALIVVVILWLGLIGTLLYKGHQLSNHPCSLCAEAQGEHVFCSIPDLGGKVPMDRYRAFYENGTITNDSRPLILQ